MRSLLSAKDARIAELEHLADNQARELVAHREKAQGNYWAWQGDGDDHLESLSVRCSVLISAKQLKDILDRIVELEAACAAMRDCLENAPHWVDTKFALSTTCGKDLLDRLKEAEWLLEHADDSDFSHATQFEHLRHDWKSRRDAWLKGGGL